MLGVCAHTSCAAGVLPPSAAVFRRVLPSLSSGARRLGPRGHRGIRNLRGDENVSDGVYDDQPWNPCPH